MFKASIWPVYRLTAKEGLLKVYIDNSSIGGPWTTQRTDYTNHLRFGCLWSRAYQGIMDWDYFYVTQDEETAPPVVPTWDITLDMTDYPINEGWSSVIGTGNDVSLFSGSGDEFLSSSVPDLSSSTRDSSSSIRDLSTTSLTSSTTSKILEQEITPGFTFQTVVTLLGVIVVLWKRKTFRRCMCEVKVLRIVSTTHLSCQCQKFDLGITLFFPTWFNFVYEAKLILLFSLQLFYHFDHLLNKEFS